MEWFFGFMLGFIADLFRSVFMPASTKWLNNFIPTAREKVNVENNILTLSIMEKLKSLGLDPALAKHARDEVAQFTNVLTSQQEAFVENEIAVIDSTYLTQTEMNLEAGHRADIARHRMEHSINALERSGWMAKAQSAALSESQTHWEEYAQAQARFVAAEFDGGTIAPLIYSSTLESAIISRTAELKRILEEMRPRCED